MKITIFIPGLLWSIIIFILLIMPGSDIPSNDFLELIYFDKWVHTALFGVLTLLWGYPFHRFMKISLKPLFYIACMATVYGILLEFVQKYYTTSRTFDNIDILADATGAFAGIFFIRKAGKHTMENK